MKTTILIGILECALFSNVHATTINRNHNEDADITEMGYPDFVKKKIAQKEINSWNFDSKSWFEQERYISAVLARSNLSFLEFNFPTLEEPVLSEQERKSLESKISDMLVQCINIIGPEEWEKSLNKDYLDGKHRDSRIYDDFEGGRSRDFATRAQSHYLSYRVLKCTRYLYIKQHVGESNNDTVKDYHIDDFEYSRILSNQEKKIEKLYETIYLSIKEAGLLRRMSYTYYPKSLLREHADKTGLTTFIKEKETQATHPLKHDELAIQFFGSREAWLMSLHKYLTDKINLK